jgi:predicted enzyme related to lactoylglutathione lyase
MARARPNPLVHVELHTRDKALACATYAQLCGWRSELVRAGGGSYTSLALGGHVGGGVVECETERSVWLPYVQVSDAIAATSRARALGASVLLEPRAGPAGWRSVVSLPACGELAFWQPRR